TRPQARDELRLLARCRAGPSMLSLSQRDCRSGINGAGRNMAAVQGGALAAESVAGPQVAPHLAFTQRAVRWLWSGALMAALAFLVLYPVAMLLLGALTNTNPVVDGIVLHDLSLANFAAVLANPNVHVALGNSLIACGGGTALAVVIGL